MHEYAYAYSSPGNIWSDDQGRLNIFIWLDPIVSHPKVALYPKRLCKDILDLLGQYIHEYTATPYYFQAWDPYLLHNLPPAP